LRSEVWTRRPVARKADAIAVRITNPYEWHEADLVRGLRDFRRDRDTPHRDAFEVWLCSVGHDVLSIKAMLDDYFEAASDANRQRP
jgi:hypothetical protein